MYYLSAKIYYSESVPRTLGDAAVRVQLEMQCAYVFIRNFANVNKNTFFYIIIAHFSFKLTKYFRKEFTQLKILS